ncbi:MAG: sensor histidine kinase [Ectothiorhodospiraceae bacterium]|nr:sensor histidine kinase [Chromatiales bacterium]MCP5156795.1 sensor histidine kinase [Ectothiorhodospiraceae bacterium]
MRIPLSALLHPRAEHRLLGLMMITLHLALWWDFGGALSRSLMLAHLGLFLLWQPLWNRERHLEIGSALLSVLAIVGFVAWLRWPFILFWLLLLVAFVGGRAAGGRRDRVAYLLGLVFLVSELLVACIPPLVSVPPLEKEARVLFSYGLLLLPLALLFVPASRGAGERGHAIGGPSVDFLYGLTLSLLTGVLALGSLLSKFLTGADYPTAVVQTILVIALFLLAIGWLWSPLAGFSGLGQIWERYLQNIGTPFEQWLARLTEGAREHERPEDFFAAAMRQLVELPWVSGVRWEGKGMNGELGSPSPYRLTTRAGGVRLELFTRRELGTPLLLHVRLLLRLVGHFFSAKEDEQRLAEQAHLRAVYETGARLTHDIKNLLQSMLTLGVAVQTARPDDREALQKLLATQLPHITQRLQLALDKLQAPDVDAVSEVDLREWWRGLEARNAGDGLRFSALVAAEPADATRGVPGEVLDSIVDNLLENARHKRQAEPGIAIAVRLEADDGGYRITVTDDGSAVPDDVAAAMFRAPLKSRTGLGIGLYQAAKLADSHDLDLTLADARAGHVEFELRGGWGEAPTPPPTASQGS